MARGEAFRVESIDPAKAAITLKSRGGRELDWRLRQWGAGEVQTFTPQALELETGDRIQFIRNDREAGRISGARDEVTGMDEQVRTATIRNPRGQTQTLSLDAARDQHIRHAYVETAFAKISFSLARNLSFSVDTFTGTGSPSKQFRGGVNDIGP